MMGFEVLCLLVSKARSSEELSVAMDLVERAIDDGLVMTDAEWSVFECVAAGVKVRLLAMIAA